MTQSSPNPREKEFGGPFETLKPRIFGKCHVLQTSPRSTHALCDDRSCHCLGSQPKSSKNPKLEAENSSFGWRHQKNFYNHLKNKATDPVLDNDGNIVYNPCHAMYTISSTWDEVYSANVLHDDPTHMLQVIWPYVDQQIQPFDIPPLTGDELLQTIQQRNPLAAPGLDGWRTTDLQSLPLSCCNQIASFFSNS